MEAGSDIDVQIVRYTWVWGRKTNDSGMCRAALAGDGAPRDCSSPPGVETAPSFDSTRENSPGLDTARIVNFIAPSCFCVVVHGLSELE